MKSDLKRVAMLFLLGAVFVWQSLPALADTTSSRSGENVTTGAVDFDRGEEDAAATLDAIVSLNQEGAQTRVVEAQTAHRGGQESVRSGQPEAARRHFAEAARLDPTFPDPWFAAAATWLPFRPDMAMGSVIDGIKAAMRSFRGQHRLVLNVSLLLIAIVTFSLLGTTLLITLRELRHFQHPIFELLRRRLPVLAAATAGWILVLQPVLWGLGAFLTLTLLAGLLWFYVGVGERKVLAAFAALTLLVPGAFHGLSRLSAPLNPESIPYLLSAASETPDQPGLADALQAAMRADPTAPSPHMALGLTFERTGRLGDAEQEYRLALERNGDEGRLYNNLGNILARTGRLDPALGLYQKAIAAAPGLAAPHFNLSRMYARRLQFDLADQEMKKASQLDFEGVRAQTAALGEQKFGLLSLGLAPGELWSATLSSPAAFPLGLPRSMGWLYGGSMALLPVFGVALLALGLAVGRALFRFLPTYSCTNCDSVVCRKCLRRIRRRAYCEPCGDTILSMQTSEFTRMLLEKRLHQEHWSRRIATVALLVVVPGWEAVRRGRPLIGLTVMSAFVLLLLPITLGGGVIGPVPSLGTLGHGPPWSILLPGLIVLYVISALLLKLLPEPESALIGQEISGTPSHDRLDRAA
ncbi:MAG: tetratricopeptide repeat protein [Candidatus Eisenbacteria bacterium]|nr:tetratricopeptide repeat protein [Candidatus Eisenbacteria bacterium]